MKPHRTRPLSSGHGFCMLSRMLPLLTAPLHGCFWVLPLPEPPVDDAPTILEPAVDPQTVIVRTPTVTLLLLAADPEGAPLSVEWPDVLNVPHTPPELVQQGDLWLARVELLDPAPLFGTTVRALVSDGNRDHLVTVRWQLEAP
jgi:hypothetical protein